MPLALHSQELKALKSHLFSSCNKRGILAKLENNPKRKIVWPKISVQMIYSLKIVYISCTFATKVGGRTRQLMILNTLTIAGECSGNKQKVTGKYVA